MMCHFRNSRSPRSRMVASLFATIVLCCVAGGCALDMAELSVDTIYQPGTVVSDKQDSPVGSQIDCTVRVDETLGESLQVAFRPTGNGLDVAIVGDGLFQVELLNGETRYTRNGAFHIDGPTGNVVNSDGYIVHLRAMHTDDEILSTTTEVSR